MVAGLNAMIEATAKSFTGGNISHVPMFERSGLCSQAADSVDCCGSYHVHPTASGYSAMAQVWFDSIKGFL